jgi:hypothetical protein
MHAIGSSLGSHEEGAGVGVERSRIVQAGVQPSAAAQSTARSISARVIVWRK